MQVVEFSKEDPEDPHQWPERKKMTIVAVIAVIAVLSPLASSAFTPGINQVADDLGTTLDVAIGAVTGFVVMQGLGPLILAPLSETFGRRALYVWCFGIFTLLQIPAALSPNIECLIAARTVAGFFGSVGVANGAGTLSDMFDKSERAGVFGWYLLGPLLGPSLGPLIGGLIVGSLGWRWIFWILFIICTINTTLGFFLLPETYTPTILAKRCDVLTKQTGVLHTFPAQDRRPLIKKIASSLSRPLRILLTQPIVIIMALYQAIIFATMYSFFTSVETIFGNAPYRFNSIQVGLMYTGIGIGYVIAVRTIVPRIDVVFNAMTKRNNGISKPEFRLPLANIGSVLLPVCTFWFGWAVELQAHWFVCILSTVFTGIGQVAVMVPSAHTLSVRAMMLTTTPRTPCKTTTSTLSRSTPHPPSPAASCSAPSSAAWCP